MAHITNVKQWERFSKQQCIQLCFDCEIVTTNRSPGFAGIPSSPLRSRRVISSICSWTVWQHNANEKRITVGNCFKYYNQWQTTTRGLLM